jgi:hypothetical protein
MKTIGGFFELELSKKLGESYHPKASALSTGRACLSVILQREKPSRVYVPFYTCDSLLVPLKELDIDYTFYSINEQLEISILPDLQPDELLVYINYFGVKDAYAQILRSLWGKKLVIDNTHSFFSIENNSDGWAYNSARKFFGVPDGAYLYGPYNTEVLPANDEISLEHLTKRLVGKQSEAYEAFVEYEKGIDSAIRSISIVSEMLLSTVDYNKCKQQRIQNFAQYHRAFVNINALPIAWEKLGTVPAFCYPLLLQKPIDRKILFRQNIFIPWLWNDVNTRMNEGYELEKNLSENLLALPIDHRYFKHDIDRVVSLIKKL